MELVNRKITYRMYPSKAQEEELMHILKLHQRLYNAALQERIDAYKKCGVSINYNDQAKSLTEIRSFDEEYRALNAQSSQVTLKRLDRAYQNFFRRVENGETPGFPRFKALNRYPGWGYATHGDGWKLMPGESGKHGRIRISGVGMVRLRGKAKTQGEPKTCEIMHKNGAWYASVTILCSPKRECGKAACGIDWGVEKILSIANDDGSFEIEENPRHTKQAAKKLKAGQRKLAKKKKGSIEFKRVKKKIAVIHRKLTNQRKDYLHKLSSKLVDRYALIATEKLTIKNMTASAKGTAEEPGKNVAQKSGLNREILSTSPAFLIQTLKYKAEEAGCQWVEINTRKEKPSQTCSCCGSRKKKKLSDRVHRCEACGCVLDRDLNAARVMLNLALFDSPQGLSGNTTGLVRPWCGGETLVSPVKHESPTIPQG